MYGSQCILLRLCLVLLFEIVYSIIIVRDHVSFITKPHMLHVYIYTIHRTNPTHGLEHMVYTQQVSTVIVPNDHRGVLFNLYLHFWKTVVPMICVMPLRS